MIKTLSHHFFRIDMKLFIVFLAVLLVANAKLLSRKRPTKAGPQGWGGKSAKAVDGNRSGNHNGQKTCTHSKHNKGAQNWWRVDLGRPHHIGVVRIWNRTDCCAKRINGAKVYAGGRLCGVVKYNGKRAQNIHCRGKVARHVIIRQPHNYLTLCEVEVFGRPRGKK